MANRGIMAENMFVGKAAILGWLNHAMCLRLERIEDTCNGALACQLMDCLHPGSVNMKKVDFNVKNAYEFVNNYKELQQAFDRAGIDRAFSVPALSKGKLQDNNEFMQWFKGYWDSVTGGADVDDYDPVARRAVSKTGDWRRFSAAVDAPSARGLAGKSARGTVPARAPASRLPGRQTSNHAATTAGEATIPAYRGRAARAAGAAGASPAAAQGAGPARRRGDASPVPAEAAAPHGAASRSVSRTSSASPAPRASSSSAAGAAGGDDARAAAAAGEAASAAAARAEGAAASALATARAEGAAAAALAAKYERELAASEARAERDLADAEARRADLAAELSDALARAETAERERDFYFDKLRDIEVLVGAPEVAAAPLARFVERILYAADGDEAKVAVSEAHRELCGADASHDGPFDDARATAREAPDANSASASADHLGAAGDALDRLSLEGVGESALDDALPPGEALDISRERIALG